MATGSTSDMGLGVGVVFGVLATLGAVLMGANSYNYVLRHAQGLETAGLLANSGLGFGLAVVAASLSIVAIHVYEG